jgi:hypothetical protein
LFFFAHNFILSYFLRKILAFFHFSIKNWLFQVPKAKISPRSDLGEMAFSREFFGLHAKNGYLAGKVKGVDIWRGMGSLFFLIFPV